ncbi:uncharacterized protein LOC128856425 [Anastrepha ludens]|uniref:uncharacterized protein LOC128856425 n=1 Tax=Anastrepha ludens TaxID=28586 RepID=UPI0023AFD9A3|nr:uncharacterized protein LOC128856425 [Anastrepha ludens]
MYNQQKLHDMIDQKKKFIEVDSPKIIREYNSHMGGVDLMDGLMGRYHIRIKSRDAIVRLFYHFLDMALTNSYVLYRQFREEIADKLVKFTEKKSFGRPKTSGKRTSVDEPLSPPPGSSAHGRKPKHPTEDLRYDGQDHFPWWLPKSGIKKAM